MRHTVARLGLWSAVLVAWQLLAMRGAPDYVLAPLDIAVRPGHPPGREVNGPASADPPRDSQR